MTEAEQLVALLPLRFREIHKKNGNAHVTPGEVISS